MADLTKDHSLDHSASHPSSVQRGRPGSLFPQLEFSPRPVAQWSFPLPLSFVSHSYHLYSGFGLPTCGSDALAE